MFLSSWSSEDIFFRVVIKSGTRYIIRSGFDQKSNAGLVKKKATRVLNIIQIIEKWFGKFFRLIVGKSSTVFPLARDQNREIPLHIAWARTRLVQQPNFIGKCREFPEKKE